MAASRARLMAADRGGLAAAAGSSGCSPGSPSRVYNAWGIYAPYQRYVIMQLLCVTKMVAGRTCRSLGTGPGRRGGRSPWWSRAACWSGEPGPFGIIMSLGPQGRTPESGEQGRVVLQAPVLVVDPV